VGSENNSNIGLKAPNSHKNPSDYKGRHLVSGAYSSTTNKGEIYGS